MAMEIEFDEEAGVLYGRRLQTLRKEKGYTLRALAEKAGLCYQTIFKIEKNMRDVKFCTFLNILKALEVKIEDFFEMELRNNLTPEEGNLIYLLRMKKVDIKQYTKIFE